MSIDINDSISPDSTPFEIIVCFNVWQLFSVLTLEFKILNLIIFLCSTSYIISVSGNLKIIYFNIYSLI